MTNSTIPKDRFYILVRLYALLYNVSWRDLHMSNRIVNLDLVKVLAAIGVVGLHAIGMVNYSIYYFCDFAVPLPLTSTPIFLSFLVIISVILPFRFS